jgi:hypothetical protein
MTDIKKHRRADGAMTKQGALVLLLATLAALLLGGAEIGMRRYHATDSTAVQEPVPASTANDV